MKNRFYVKKENTFLIAGVVWLLAGFNVARMGILSYLMIDTKMVSVYFFNACIFCFWGDVLKMSKNTRKKEL